MLCLCMNFFFGELIVVMHLRKGIWIYKVKWLVHSKLKITSSFTRPEFVSFMEKIWFFLQISCPFSVWWKWMRTVAFNLQNGRKSIIKASQIHTIISCIHVFWSHKKALWEKQNRSRFSLETYSRSLCFMKVNERSSDLRNQSFESDLYNESINLVHKTNLNDSQISHSLRSSFSQFHAWSYWMGLKYLEYCFVCVWKFWSWKVPWSL